MDLGAEFEDHDEGEELAGGADDTTGPQHDATMTAPPKPAAAADGPPPLSSDEMASHLANMQYQNDILLQQCNSAQAEMMHQLQEIANACNQCALTIHFSLLLIPQCIDRSRSSSTAATCMVRL